MNLVKHLVNVQQGYQALLVVWAAVKPWLIAGHRLEIEVRPERRTSSQNAALHAMLGEIAAQKEWAGEFRSVEVWKRLVVGAWLRARGDSVEVLPALDKHGVEIVYAPTHKMTKAQLIELIDWVGAWCAENGVELRDPQSMEAV